MTGLAIADGLVLPDDAVTETFCILAKRGKGKTYTASVLAEELVKARLPVVVLDPTGVWWGLRSSADGRSDGLPVVIFGGDHADVPLEEGAGQLVADVIVAERIPAVIDLSALSKAGARRFAAAFLERLYRRNRDPLHVIVDEADLFAPQRATGDTAKVLGAMEDLVRRGRAHGLGTTLVTQRPAVLHKDVLSQAEVLVAMGMTGVRDVAAIDEWVRLHADEDQAVELKRSLPSLGQGAAWVWSPSWLSVLQRVQVRRRRTFDSSATPKAGERRTVPKRMAAVDLDALGEKIAATAERAKAHDPRQLRATIARLERDLASARAETPEPVVHRVEVPVLEPHLVEVLQAVLEPYGSLLDQAHKALGQHLAASAGYTQIPLAGRPSDRRTPGVGEPPAASPSRPGRGTARSAPAAAGAPPAGQGPLSDDVHLKAGARRILETLAAHHPMRVTRAQLGTLAGFKITGGTFGTYWSTLKRHGLVDEGRDVGITDAGLAYVGGPAEPMTPEQVVDRWRTVLKAGARLMLDELMTEYPDGLGRDELAERVGMTPTGGTFGTYLSTLKRNGLAELAGGTVRASDSLYLGDEP